MKNYSTLAVGRFVLLVFSLFGLVACGGGGGSDVVPQNSVNPSSSVRTSLIAVGDVSCPFGGILVESGIDDNANGVLDSAEVNTSEKVCNGATGTQSLVDINAEPAGANCLAGGLRIDSGVDSNGNAILDATEISKTGYVCSNNGNIGWQDASIISDDNNGNNKGVLSPSVAVDAAGNAIAVWSQKDALRYSIWANRYKLGKGWGVPELIETDNSGGAWSPQISVDDFGNAVAVWAQDDGTRYNIWSNRYVVGAGWATAQLIETENNGDALSVKLSVDASGNAIAVWTQVNIAGSRDIWANRYVVGSGWGVAELIENSGDGGSTVDLAMDASGNAIAVWSQSDAVRSSIFANRYVVGAGWGAAVTIENDDLRNLSKPRIAMDSGGNAVAVWEQQISSTQANIASNRYVVGTGWGVDEVIASNLGRAMQPQVVLDDDGNIVVAWRLRVALASVGSYRVDALAMRYTAATGWGMAELIEMDDTYNVSIPTLVSDGAGNVKVFWLQNYSFLSKRYLPSVGWSAAELVGKGVLGLPGVSVNGSGTVWVVWEGGDIWGNRWLAPYVE